MRRLERESAVTERPLREAVAAEDGPRPRRRLLWLLPLFAMGVGVVTGAAALIWWTERVPSEAVDVAAAPSRSPTSPALFLAPTALAGSR